MKKLDARLPRELELIGQASGYRSQAKSSKNWPSKIPSISTAYENRPNRTNYATIEAAGTLDDANDAEQTHRPRSKSWLFQRADEQSLRTTALYNQFATEANQHRTYKSADQASWSAS